MARLSQIWQAFRLGGVGPGLILMLVILLCRLTAVLELWELRALDLALRMRGSEPMDSRIVIVGLDEADLRAFDQYPFSDRQLSEIIQTLQSYRPRVIGVDYFRDRPIPPGEATLEEIWQTYSNVIGIERILPESNRQNLIQGPKALPPEQVGFVDTILDQDGFVRRSLLGTYPLEGEYRFSFTLRVAQQYLQGLGISLENGIQDPEAMRFGNLELQRVQAQTGGYIHTDSGGNQILLNFRSGPQPFRVLRWREIASGQVKPSWLRDRVVLLGSMAISEKDLVNSNAIAGFSPGLVYGIELQAHAISQILSAVIDERPLLHTWSDLSEYLWIVAWGLVGLLLGRLRLTPSRYMLLMVGLALTLVSVSYGAILLAWWIPVVPTLAIFLINALVLDGFYLYDQGLRAIIHDRQQVIENTFNAIHNGPLQTLGQLQRTVDSDALDQSQVSASLSQLNEEIRDIYESIRQETLGARPVFMLGSDRAIALDNSLEKILFEVYRETWERDFPYFRDIQVKVVSFKTVDETYLTLEQKRELCRFFEEALCNVGKYAVQAQRVKISCGQTEGENFIQVIDNGQCQQEAIAPQQKQGRGTQQAIQLAKSLGGNYQREPHFPKGTCCRFSWPVKPIPWWRQWYQ